jgi:hypothetical protein
MNPLESYDIELLKKYSAALLELEVLPSATIELTAEQALAVVTFLQFAAADAGGRNNSLLQSAIAAAKQIQSSFNPESAIFQVLELGWRVQS